MRTIFKISAARITSTKTSAAAGRLEPIYMKAPRPPLLAGDLSYVVLNFSTNSFIVLQVTKEYRQYQRQHGCKCDELYDLRIQRNTMSTKGASDTT